MIEILITVWIVGAVVVFIRLVDDGQPDRPIGYPVFPVIGVYLLCFAWPIIYPVLIAMEKLGYLPKQKGK